MLFSWSYSYYLLIIITKKDLFLNRLNTQYYFLFGLYALSIYEYIGHHLSTSDLVDAPWMRHVPTVVYFNLMILQPYYNDVYVFIVFFKDKHKSIFILAIFTVHILIIYYSQPFSFDYVTIVFYLSLSV